MSHTSFFFNAFIIIFFVLFGSIRNFALTIKLNAISWSAKIIKNNIETKYS